MAENSELYLTIEGRSSPSYYVIELAGSFEIGSIACFSDQFAPLCDVNGRIVTVTSGTPIPALFTLRLTGLTNPSTLPNDYSSVTSYSSTDYIISQDRNTVILT